MLVLAQVSDLHVDLGDGGRSLERAERVMDYINRLRQPIDAVVVTGDLADSGAAAEYEAVRAVLASPYPVLACPGNHDVRDSFRTLLLDAPAGDGQPVNQVHRVGNATFALCDSTIPGRVEGYLAGETIDWLEEVLDAAPDGPVFVCMHHPPVALGIPLVDGINQREPERLERVIRRHPRVTAVLCGHAHAAASTWFADRPLLVASGVASTAMLPWERPDPDAVDYALPPVIAFHLLDGGRLTTHVRVIP